MDARRALDLILAVEDRAVVAADAPTGTEEEFKNDDDGEEEDEDEDEGAEPKSPMPPT